MPWSDHRPSSRIGQHLDVFDPLAMPESTTEKFSPLLPAELPTVGVGQILKMAVAPHLAPWCTHGVSATFAQSFGGCRTQRLSTGTLGMWFQNCGTTTQLTVSGPYSFSPIIPHQSLHDSTLLFIRPGAAFSVLGIPASELTCRRYALDDLLPGEGTRLTQQILEVTCPVQRLHVMQAWVESRIARFARARDHELTAGLMRWLANPGRLSDLVGEVGGSQRQIQRWFADGVGLAPRELDTLWQVGRVARQAMTQARVDWTALALDHGFSDQPHLTRRWREVLGDSPAHFHRRWRAGGQWLDGLMIAPPEPTPETMT